MKGKQPSSKLRRVQTRGGDKKDKAIGTTKSNKNDKSYVLEEIPAPSTPILDKENMLKNANVTQVMVKPTESALSTPTSLKRAMKNDKVEEEKGSQNGHIAKKKRVVINYSKKDVPNHYSVYTTQVNKTESGIIILTLPNNKKRYTWMEDMERKSFLQDSEMHFAKNFKARNSEGVALNKIQTIGMTGKSTKGATCFIHIISDEEEYNKDEESYLRNLTDNLVKNMNNLVEKRATQFEDIVFKVPKAPFMETMTKEPLSNFLSKEDCLELFSFVYDKDVPEYANVDHLLSEFPHITKEFLGNDSKQNRDVLKKVR